MNWMWIVWLLVVAVSFIVIERYAIQHPEKQWTLSRTIATWGARWPLSIGLWGMFFGGLMVHFFWHFGCSIK